MKKTINRILERLPELDIDLVKDITELIEEYGIMKMMALRTERAIHGLVKELEKYGHWN